MPIHNGTEWKSELAWWVKVSGEWKKSTKIWKKVSGVWEKMTLEEAIATVTTFAGSGTEGDSDGIGVLAEFNTPSGIAIDSGFAYICDFYSRKIRKINLSTSEVTTFAGSGANGSADGIGVLAEFNTPTGIAIDSGFAYICDSNNRNIRKINLSTSEVTTFAGSGSSGSADGVGILASFNTPIGIAIDSGFAYICDSNNRNIRKINLTTAEVTTFAGSGVNGSADGIGVLAEFNTPIRIAIDSGFAYICDALGNKIRKINLSTSEVTTFAGSGVNGSADGIGVLAEFNTPIGVDIYSRFAYICDSGNDKIRSITLELE